MNTQGAPVGYPNFGFPPTTSQQPPTDSSPSYPPTEPVVNGEDLPIAPSQPPKHRPFWTSVKGVFLIAVLCVVALMIVVIGVAVGVSEDKNRHHTLAGSNPFASIPNLTSGLGTPFTTVVITSRVTGLETITQTIPITSISDNFPPPLSPSPPPPPPPTTPPAPPPPPPPTTPPPPPPTPPPPPPPPPPTLPAPSSILP